MEQVFVGVLTTFSMLKLLSLFWFLKTNGKNIS